MLHAQLPWDATQQEIQQSGATDCSNPEAANSPACNSQTQNQSGGGGLLNSQGGASGSATPGLVPPNTTYTDESNGAYGYPRSRVTQLPPLPPEPLSEFQKFVAATTGMVLPIYGEDLFRNVPSTFAPLNLTPVPPDYVIGPGDQIRVRVWGQVNFRANLTVDRSGDIYIPVVGPIHVAGLPFSDLYQHLRSAVSRVYRNFDLTADIGQISAIQVYVTGQARRPGVYTVSSLSTLADALFSSGGPALNGSMRDIQLQRNGKKIADFDLYDLLIHGDKSNDPHLLSGDIIFIPGVGPRIALVGSVRTPAIYEMRPGETIGQALNDAGGISSVAADSRLSVERINDHRDRIAFEISMNAASLASPLTDGDILRVFPILPRYQKTITLRGNTANPGRFAWHPGMRLSDLIPDRFSLITRNYWWQRTLLGLPSPEFEPADQLLNLHQPSHPVDLQQLAAQQGISLQSGGLASSQQALAQQALAARALQQKAAASGSIAPQGETPVPQLQTQLGAQEMGAQDQLSNPSASSPLPAQPRPGEYAANGSVASGLPGSNAQSTGAFPPRNDVRLLAPEIDWSYAVIERMDPKTLKTSLIPFDLGRLVLDHDSSQDLALEPGDIVTIFSQADVRVPLEQQTKFVHLEGEFVHAGVYSVQPGETLRDLVRRAGGLTPKAYLYGSEFLRESTRILQQRRIDEYVQQLQMQIERGSLALAASPAATAQGLAGGAAAQSSEHELIAQLRQIRATGRVVLELRPGSSGVDSLPDIDLEDGDRFIIPPVPVTVNVVGAVYDQSSFLYHNNRRTGDYLRMAGGPGRDADSKHAFIIRADGSVISRNAANGIWGNTFDALPIYPGDTIVVPEKTIKPSAMGNFVYWSQMFSQLALGVAAIEVIQ